MKKSFALLIFSFLTFSAFSNQYPTQSEDRPTFTPNTNGSGTIVYIPKDYVDPSGNGVTFTPNLVGSGTINSWLCNYL